jgi:CheY-like chemotaxis protein
MTIKMRVLIVDDDPCVRVLVSEIVKPHSSFIECSENGLEAITEVSKNHYDLIFMDIEMPKLNGIATSKVIKQKNPDIKIVANTSLQPEDIKIHCRDGLFDDCIQKGSKHYSSQLLLSLVLHQSR